MRLPGSDWRVLLREHELRIASASGDGEQPYAVTTRSLAGDVRIQIQRQWWEQTPSSLRAQALAEHSARVQAAMTALGSPADLFWLLAMALRGGLVLLSGAPGSFFGSTSLAGWLGLPELAAAGLIWGLSIALGLVRGSLLTLVLRPVCRWQVRRWLRRHGT